MRHRHVGLLFDHDFDAEAHRRLEAGASAAPWRFERAGFDLFAFPSQLRLIGFDLERFAAAQARRARRCGWAGVISHHEHFGALAAALVAEAAGLPGTSPEAVLACQDKLHARRVLARVAPESTPAFAALEWHDDTWCGDPVELPSFAKPRKSAFSVLARRVQDAADLHLPQASSLIERTKRSANAFEFGEKGGNRMTSAPPSARNSRNRWEYFVSRSMISYLLPASAPSASSSKLRPI